MVYLVYLVSLVLLVRSTDPKNQRVQKSEVRSKAKNPISFGNRSGVISCLPNSSRRVACIPPLNLSGRLINGHKPIPKMIKDQGKAEVRGRRLAKSQKTEEVRRGLVTDECVLFSIWSSARVLLREGGKAANKFVPRLLTER